MKKKAVSVINQLDAQTQDVKSSKMPKAAEIFKFEINGRNKRQTSKHEHSWKQMRAD